MPQPFCTGPVHVYVAISQSQAYLGTGERAPRRRTVMHYAPVMNDLGGTIVPFDVAFEGREGFVTVRLTRFSWGVLQSIPQIGNTGDTDGIDVAGDIGTLMLLEGKAFGLWLVYPYASKQAMTGMPAGFHYPAAVMESLDDQPGTEAEYVDVTFHCYRLYDPGTGKFTLFDNNTSGLPAPS